MKHCLLFLDVFEWLQVEGAYPNSSYDEAKLDPNLAGAWSNKGVALSCQGKYDQAIQACDKAIELDPKYAATWYNKGNTPSSLVHTSEADASFTKAKEPGYKS